MTEPRTISALWSAFKATESEYDAACIIECRLESTLGVFHRGQGPKRVQEATAKADAIEARMSALIALMCNAPVRTLADLQVLARLAAARSDDRHVNLALAHAVVALSA